MTLTLIIERFIHEHVPFTLKMEVKLKGRWVELTKLNLTSTVYVILDNFLNREPRGGIIYIWQNIILKKKKKIQFKPPKWQMTVCLSMSS